MPNLYGYNFAPDAKEAYDFWVKHNPRIVRKINQLIDDICQHPKTGIGKPEALKHELSGFYSRRISLEHRLLYCIDEESKTVTIVSCMYHY